MSPREQTCTRSDALARLADARSMMVVADLVSSDDTIPGVGGALAVLAGIAASDADDAHYGLGSLAAGEERKMVEWAHRLVDNAAAALER